MNYCDLNENTWMGIEEFGFISRPTTNRVRMFSRLFIKYKDKDRNIRRSVMKWNQRDTTTKRQKAIQEKQW